MITSPVANLLDRDLESVLDLTPAIWSEFRRARIFITGGTGFVGSWLLETLLRANDRLGLDLEIAVLTRDPHRFCDTSPHLAHHPAVALVRGDVRNFDEPRVYCTHVIHAAAETRAEVHESDPRSTTDVSVSGALRVLDFAMRCEARKVLLVSSGAVYSQPSDFREDEYSVESPAPSWYGENKRLVEGIFAGPCFRNRIDVKVARCFSFIGPYLPIDRTYAAGNFIRDAIAGGPVVARSNANFRSYMYAADMVVWLCTILAQGETGRPYNVGSERRITTVDLAKAVAEAAGVDFEIRDEGSSTGSLGGRDYVPDTTRARTELGLRETVDLKDAIRRTLDWHGGINARATERT